MKVVELGGVDDLAIAERPEPVPGVGESLVRARVASICGTDVKIVGGKIPVDYPRVVGHEMIGEVVASSNPATVPGTRVLVNPAIECGHCDLCRRGLGQLCREGGLLGRDIDGVFAEYVVVPDDRLHVVPDTISQDAGALLQVLGTCVHAQRTVEIQPGGSAAVIGLGVSGLLHVQLLVAAGLTTVLGITRSQSKLDLALEMGATATAVPEDAAELVDEATAGRGADIVIDSVGREETLAQAIGLAGFHADIVLFGIMESGGSGLPYYQLYYKELTLHGTRAAVGEDYDAGIALAARGALNLEPLITKRFGFTDAAEAFASLGEPGSLKVALEVGS